MLSCTTTGKIDGYLIVTGALANKLPTSIVELEKALARYHAKVNL
jgi:hypothetical protein